MRTKNCSRREFVTQSISGLASIGLMGFAGKYSFQDKSTEKTIDKEIIHRTLGKTGIQLPIVNMGVMNSSDGALVKKSYEIGVRYFDTAAYYQEGKNEEMIGKALQELGVRKDVVIGTKVFIQHQKRNMPPEQAKAFYLQTAAESLKRLQTDYVDILFSHNVSDIDYLNNPGILAALQELKKQKKTRFIGFTTHKNMAECIGNAVETGHYDVIETAFNYAMFEDEKYIDILNKAHACGIGLIAMKTQCMQYWYRQALPQAFQDFYNGRILHTAVLKWVLRHPFISTAIPGYTTFDQMDQDFSVAYDLDYTTAEKKFLDDRNVKYSLGYCIQCGRCVSTCPRAVDIPALMRIHLYASCYGNFHQARSVFDNIDPGKGLSNCTSCHTCQAQCANRIDLFRRIQELKTIYV